MSLPLKFIVQVSGSRYLVYLAAFFLILLILSPYAMNGFWGDDALNSQVHFWAERTHGSVWELSTRIFNEWLTLRGRLMAGFLHGYYLFYFFSDLQSLRLAHCISILINIGIFSYILSYLSFKKELVLTWAVLFVGLFQIGDALDPVAAFAFHYPILTIQLFLPVIFLLKWSGKQVTAYLVIAMILWFLAMMYYEINAIFLPIALFFILKYSGNRRSAIRNLVIMAVPAAAYVLLNYYLRIHAVNPDYEGSNFGQFSLFPVTYLKQLTSSFPLSAYLLGQHYKSIDPIGLIQIGLHSKIAWGIFILGFFFFYAVLKSIRAEWISTQAKFQIFVIGLVMLFIPPAIMAISSRYQNEIGWGRGTLCQYYQYFGVALILLWILSWFSFRHQIPRVSVALGFSLYLALNTMENMRIVTAVDADYFRGPRELFIQQARAGLFDEVRDGDIIEIAGTPHYVNANLIYEGSAKNVFVPNDAPPWFAAVPAPEAARFLLSRNSSGRYELTKPPLVVATKPDTVKKEPVFQQGIEIYKSSFNGQKNNIKYHVEEMTLDEDKLYIFGWAFIEDSPRPDLTAGLIIESRYHKMFFPFAGGFRPDVKSVFTGNTPDSSGFMLLISRRSLKQIAYQAAIGFYNKKTRIIEYKTPLPAANFDNSPPEPDESFVKFRPGTAVQAAEFQLALDQLECSPGRILVDGWASEGGSPPVSVSVVLKDKGGIYWKGKTKVISRPDVAGHFKNPALTSAGFSAHFSTQSIPTGEYEVSILFMKKNGKGLLKFSKFMNIRHLSDSVVTHLNEKYIEGPLQITFDVAEESDREIKYAGWAIMKSRDSKDCKIKLMLKSMNGVVYVSTTTTVLRHDVSEFFNNVHNFDKSGFEVSVPRKELPTGKYQIGIMITFPDSNTPVAQFTDRYLEQGN